MAASTVETAVAEGGAYELIRARLESHSDTLARGAKRLNDARLDCFGGQELAITGSLRIRTENNCVPRDIVQVGGLLLFGYNVHIGLRTETQVADVFGLYAFADTADGVEMRAASLSGSFLDDDGFRRDFQELYRYYKEASLAHLRLLEGKLLACFQTGRGRDSVKVFRWGIERDGGVRYLDSRGERDDVLPPAQAFEWTATDRDLHVEGRHPHVNILNTVFVETVGGDLTVKIEDNTDTGLGIYQEPVDDINQSLADATIHYAQVSGLILLKILPYGESDWRYLVYNPRNESVVRIDAIGIACQPLPEDHGIVFPGGSYLQDGSLKRFDSDIADLEFRRQIRSPNGEDVLYVFYHWEEGRFELLAYNLIRKALVNPIVCHGYSIFPDGRMVVFRDDGDEPTRVHAMQVWATPFLSEEAAAAQAAPEGILGQVGNRDLVRGVSDAFSIRRMISEATPTVRVYEELIQASRRMLDSYHWLGHADINLQAALTEISATAELVLNEFEKVESAREQANQALSDAEGRQRELLSATRAERFQSIDDYVGGLDGLRRQRGQLITLQELRYVDLERLQVLEAETVERFDGLSRQTVDFLLRDDALAPYRQQVEAIDSAVDQLHKAVDAEPVAEQVEQLATGLDLLNEVVTGLKIADATQRTAILERLSEVLALVNRSKAGLALKTREIRATESAAEFAVEFKLYGQSVTSALNLADTPESCEEQLSRLLIQLEELEARFGEFDEYAADLISKREEVYEAFEARKQALIEARQRRAATLTQSAERILSGVERRARGFADSDALNTYLASDPMVLKLRDLITELRELGEAVRADDLASRLKSARDQAARALRDRADLFEGDGHVIRLGKHRFSVNTQTLDLTLLPLGDDLGLYLSGTDYREPVNDPDLLAARDYWQQERVSETAEVYRAEYLAASLLFAAEAGQQGLSLTRLREAAAAGDLAEIVRRAAAERYDEGYERGVHDADALKILSALLDLREQAGLLRYRPEARALAWLFWGRWQEPVSEEPWLKLDQPAGETRLDRRQRWQRQARSLGLLSRSFGNGDSEAVVVTELVATMTAFCAEKSLDHDPALLDEASRYLVAELANDPPRFTTVQAAGALVNDLLQQLQHGRQRAALEEDLAALRDAPGHQYRLALDWLRAFHHQRGTEAGHGSLLPEAAARLCLGDDLNWAERPIAVQVTVAGLLGQHSRIRERRLSVQLDEFLSRLGRFAQERVPGYRAYRQLRQQIIDRERQVLRLEEYLPHPLTSFVRNRLIDEVYLHLIGDNLAKQMGTVGEDKRTDLMGMLLLISPPGYGKTTLMEYVASRLGLIFMKVNGPALGHNITSTDPAEAGNAAARQELEKLNLALEMGNNVMLYLDDIQHTNPEFLQKFIALADGTRRMEGVWRGRSRTYDLRGKRFCVVMAGNPYTESGETFTIPDMLANRADIYNLGDVLSGKGDLFALSYLENTLTSNPTLAPLANRDMADVYKLIRLAQGEEVSTNDLSHRYSGAELNDILAVLQKLFRVQEVLLAVNLQYIASASQADHYRTEPPFKLQGSYRNMNKLAEKIVPIMNAAELEALIDDHYAGESQTLTSGAEENLLKLKELRGTLDTEEAERWAAITSAYQRRQAVGGDEADPATRIATPLAALGQQLAAIHQLLEQTSQRQFAAGEADQARLATTLERMSTVLEKAQLQVQVVNQPVPGVGSAVVQLTKLLETVLMPMFSATHNKLSLDHAIWQKLQEVERTLGTLDRKLLSKGNVRQQGVGLASSED